MKPLDGHISRKALSDSEGGGNDDVQGGCFHYDHIPREHRRAMDDNRHGMEIALAVERVRKTMAPRSAYRADDPLGFPWSTVRLLPDDPE